MEVSLKNISYHDLLKDINIDFNVGITGIIGSNGSGKSLLLKIMTGELKPTSGEVLINKKLGYIDCVNFKMPNNRVYEYLKNILIMKKYKLDSLDERIDKSLIMVGLEDKKYRNINSLSQSELIRLRLASVLIYNPKVIIIDEPFITLDDSNLKKLLKIFRLLKLRYNKVVIIATNKIDILHKIVDKVYVLNKGKLVIEGDKYEVFKQEKDLKKYNLVSPDVVHFSNLVLEKKNKKIGYRDEINDLIKDIYRYK